MYGGYDIDDVTSSVDILPLFLLCVTHMVLCCDVVLWYGVMYYITFYYVVL